MISALGDEDEGLVCKSLDCLKTMAYNEKIRDHIVENGCVSILCSIILQELTEVPVEVLKHSIQLIVVLSSNQDAR